MTLAIPLGEVVDVSAGQPAPKPDEFSNSGEPFIRAGSLESLIAGAGEETCERISEETAQRKRLRLYPENTILFAKSGMSAKLGRVYKLKRPAYVVSHLAALAPIGKYDPNYLSYWLRNNPPSHLIKDDAYPSIRTSEISNLEVPNIDIDEQRRIAAILDKADAIRRKRQQALALADDFLKSVFLEMFGDPRSIQVTDILLDDVANISRGRFSPRPRNDPRYYNGPHPFIQTGEIAGSDGYMSDYRQTLNENGFKVSKSFPSGTVFVAIVGATIGATAISTREFWCPDSVIGITPKNSDYPAEFIEYLLRFWRPVFVDRAPETARANINLQSLKPVPVPKLTNGEGIRFAQLYKGIHKFKCSLQRMDDQLFASLSQRAFRGEL